MLSVDSQSKEISNMDINELSLEELKELGWDGNPRSLENFKNRLKSALSLGWDPYEMSLEEFEELEENDEPSEEERRRLAEENGWDEEEMDLEEFEDLFM